MSTNLNSHRHCVYKINLHIVFVTKYRRQVITSEILTRIRRYFPEYVLDRNLALIEFGGESDRVHLLIDRSPDVAPAKLVNSFKTVSTRLIRKEFAEHINKFYWKPVFWTGAPKCN
ncbi:MULTISPECIES: IS200/IS605 family transposase [Aerosakkonema]|uniref:IS200/IS605 family transposase n=1 Tax=Aerosakkonema TaxID=1246629 RepID=UPI0035B88E8A